MLSQRDIQFIREHRLDDIRKLALKSSFYVSQGINMPEVIPQIAGCQLIEAKIPSWYANDRILFPARLALEQCSSEATARYKASLLSGSRFVDLTAGFGVDCAFISENFDSAVYVERQEALCSLARQNFQSLGLNRVSIVHSDAVSYLDEFEAVDCIYLDPARRSTAGRKTVALSDCEPDLNLLKERLLNKAQTVAVKMSPMLDISSALHSLPETRQVHVISVDNECKELFFILEKGWKSEPEILAVNLSKGNPASLFSFSRPEEKNTEIPYASGVQRYLYEPNASLLKAGPYKLLSQRLGIEKLHPDSHLYTSRELCVDFPGRRFEVQAVFSFNKNELKTHLKELKQAHVSVRNFPMKADELRKKLGLKEGGDIYLFATTLADGSKVLIKNIRK